MGRGNRSGRKDAAWGGTGTRVGAGAEGECRLGAGAGASPKPGPVQGRGSPGWALLPPYHPPLPTSMPARPPTWPPIPIPRAHATALASAPACPSMSPLGPTAPTARSPRRPPPPTQIRGRSRAPRAPWHLCGYHPACAGRREGAVVRSNNAVPGGRSRALLCSISSARQLQKLIPPSGVAASLPHAPVRHCTEAGNCIDVRRGECRNRVGNKMTNQPEEIGRVAPKSSRTEGRNRRLRPTVKTGS